MKFSQRVYRRLVVVMLWALLMPFVNISHSNAQAADPVHIPPTPGFTCYDGAVAPASVLCYVQEVRWKHGQQRSNVKVTLEVKGRDIPVNLKQPANFPAGSDVIAIDVGQYGALPTDLIRVKVQQGGPKQQRYVALNPDPITRTHVEPPLVVGAARELAPGIIWGSVYKVGSLQALPGAEVKLFVNDQLVQTTRTVTQTTEPIYSFSPQTKAWPSGTILRLEASYTTPQHQTLVQNVSVSWEGEPLRVPIVLDWGCLGQAPRSGGVDNIPQSFCLSGRGVRENKPVDDALVSISVGTTSIMTTTRALQTTGDFGFAIDIGTLVWQHSPTEDLRLTIIKDGFAGTTVRSLESLGVGKEWGYQINVPLQSEIIPGIGLTGGTPVPIVLDAIGNTLNTMVGLPFGGGVSIQYGHDANPIRRLGNRPSALPAPEVSALLVLRHLGDGTAVVLAGTRSGQLVLSTSSGTSWTPIGTSLGQAIQALTPSGNGSVYVAAGTTIREVRVKEGTRELVQERLFDALPFTPRGLAVVGEKLVAAAANGLWAMDSSGTWQQISTEATTAIALMPSSTGSDVLVGSEAGLQRRSPDLRQIRATVLDRPILGIAATDWASGAIVRVTTPDGVLEATPALSPTWNWKVAIGSDAQTAPTTVPTTGAPDIFDLVQESTGAILAGGPTGLHRSSDGGQNWSSVAPPPNKQAIRSLATLNNGDVLALTSRQLYRLFKERWEPLNGLPTQALNGAVVASDSSGQNMLVGRGAGPGFTLYASRDRGLTWQGLDTGRRGVTDIVMFPTPVNGVAALVATDGDGIFSWQPQSMLLAALPPNGLNPGERVASLGIVTTAQGCMLLLGTFGNGARIGRSPCSNTPTWSFDTALSSATGSVGLINALAGTSSGTLFAATSEGIFRSSIGTTSWQQSFGLPLRPLALVVPRDYDVQRLLATGGPQAGVLLLNDTQPDLGVVLQSPQEQPAGEVITYTVRLHNQGVTPLLGVKADLQLDQRLVLEPANQPLTWSVSLAPGQEHVEVVTARIPSTLKPTQITATLSAPSVPGESFVANNIDESRTNILYRHAPDPFILTTGATMTPANTDANLVLLAGNVGTRQSGTSTISFTQPAEMIITKMEPAPDRSNGPVHEWNVSQLAPEAEYNVVITYQLPGGLTNLPLMASATITSAGDDREVSNNDSQAWLRYPPDEPTGAILTNWRRQSRYGETVSARAQLNTILSETGAVEISLDTGAPCEDSPTPVACAYDDFDAANAQLADKPADKHRAEAALEAREQLVSAITTYLKDQLALYPTVEALYLIGGDDVLPSAASYLTLPPNQSLLAESSYVGLIPAADSLYAPISLDYYLTDRVYMELFGQARLLVSGRQPGSSESIATAFKRFNDSSGKIVIDKGVIAGTARQLTENSQRLACQMIKERGLPAATDCSKISESADTAQGPIKDGEQIVSMSGHSTDINVGPLHSRSLAQVPLDQINLLLLLGCHTGLATSPVPGHDESLAVAAAGQPIFGYSAYAYAVIQDGDTLARLQYAERLHLLLLDRLLEGNLTLGEAYQRAIDDYGPIVNDSISQKTIESLMLYGSPMYQVVITGAGETDQAGQATAEQAGAAGSGAEQTIITLTPTYSETVTADGRYFTAAMPQAQGQVLLQAGLPIMPGARVEIPSKTTHVLVLGGAYTEQQNVDPVIVRAAPLAEPRLYQEPAYIGPNWAWADYAPIHKDGDGRTWLTLSLGRWSPQDNRQRLFSSLKVKLMSVPSGDKKAQPALPSPSLCRLGSRQTRVTLPDQSNLQQVEAVVFANGEVKTQPLSRRNSRWDATLAVDAGTEIFVQAVTKDGQVLTDTNAGAFYTVTSNLPQCTGR